MDQTVFRRIREAVDTTVSLREANDQSLNERMRAVELAVSARFNGDGQMGPYCYADLVFDTFVVIRKGPKLFRLGYTVDGLGNVTLDAGDPVQVRMAPVTVGAKESDGQLFGPLADEGQDGDGQLLQEGEQAPTGKKWGILIIQEGMSKNRNRYQRKVLQEAAPLYEGVKIYLDHEEGSRRYGRSTQDVAGFVRDVQPVLMSTAKEGADGRREAGSVPIFGLAATAVITKRSTREELLDAYQEGCAGLYGFSHDITAETVVVADPSGAFYDVTRIEEAKSVDLVTNPAAGGRVLRLVATNTVAPTLHEDEAMLKKLIEAIRNSGRADLVAKLDALGDNPNEDQILAIHREAITAAPVTTQAPTPAPAAPAAPVQEAVSAVDVLELRRDGLNSYLTAGLAECSLPDAVKDVLRKRFTGQISEATGGAALPTKAQITEAIREQVELFGRLADANVVVPAAAGRPRIEMGAGRKDKLSEALDAFFGVKATGAKDQNGQPVYALVAESARRQMSFRNLYVDITGDVNVTGMVKEATRLTESLDTSSFDQILGDSITRRMVAEYQQAPQAVWRGTIAEVVPVSDFRTQRRMRYGGYGNLTTVAQGAPYPSMTSPTDEEATYAAIKRGGTEELTIEMITNDDVGAIRRIPQRMARAASQTLYEFVFDFMRTNAAIYDATALAAAGHGSNISTTGLSSAQLVAARLAMKKQADMSNGKRIGLAARYLWIPSDLEELAFQLTMATKAINDAGVVTTAEPSAPNFVNKVGIEARVVDYWTDANNWWLTADVSQTPMIEIGFLGGREEPELFVQDTPNQGSLFSNDKITYKLRHIYGGAVLDYRGFFGGIVP